MSATRSYVATYIALLVLTAASAFTHGAVSLIVALIEGALIALVFLRLRRGRRLYTVIFLTGLAFFVLLLSACFLDVVTRETVQPQIPRGVGLR